MLLPSSLTDTDITTFAHSLTGTLVRPGDAAYGDLRAVFNRVGNPAFIVRVVSADDVAKTVRFAVTHKLPLAIRSGGHGIAGTATNDGGLVIDMAELKAISVLDSTTGHVRIETGAIWGEVAADLGEHGLAISSGDTSSVGVGGLLTGGGIGWMARKYGLAIDSLIAADVVLATGKQVRATKDDHADLFWAIRGGGGNFGVVTAVELLAHKETNVIFGTVAYDASEGAVAMLTRWFAFTQAAPREITTNLSIVPQSLTRPATLALTVCCATDDLAAGEKMLAPLQDIGPIIHHGLHLLPYSTIMANHGRAHFSDFKAVHRTLLAESLTPAMAQTMAMHFTKPGAPMLQLRGLGGAISAIAPEATAYAYRSHALLVVAMQRVTDDVATTDRALDTLWQPLAQFATGSYSNFVGKTDVRGQSLAYPESTRVRLVTIKQHYDPNGVFCGPIALQ